MSNSKNIKLLNAVPANVNVVSEVLDTRDVDAFSVQTNWTEFSGTVHVLVQVSNVIPSAPEAINWVSLETVTLSSATGNHMSKVDVSTYSFVRVKLIQTNGNGIVTAIFSGK